MPQYQVPRIVVGLVLSMSADALLAQGQTDPAESPVIRAATLVLQSTASASKWEGFSGPAEFIVCTRDGGTLYALREPPSPSSNLVKLGGSTIAQLYYSPERPPRLETRCFYLDFNFEGRKLLAFPEIDSIYHLVDPVRALAVALVHEEFHRYQLRAFAPTSGPDDFHPLEAAIGIPGDLIDSKQFQCLAQEERSLLAEAIYFSDPAEIRSIIDLYLELRDRRMALVPERLRAGEAHEERKEGSAHIVSYEVVAAAAGEAPSYVADLVLRDLLRMPRFDQTTGRSWYRHWHIYATGAAIALILDKLGVGWREEVEAGATLLDRLRTAALAPNKR